MSKSIKNTAVLQLLLLTDKDLDLLERSWDFAWLGQTGLDFPQNNSGQDYRSVDSRLGRLVAVACPPGLAAS